MIQQHVTTGLSPLEVPLPLTCNEWANTHFFLPAESSSIEGPWQSLPYQVGPLNWMGNDDIKIVDWKKAARVGYTKSFCAAVGYHAEHKKRNQIIYQPTDGDAQQFVQDEIDPLLIHIPVMRAICKTDPEKRSSDSTKFRKKFYGSTLDILGGKSGRNYRRLTKDVVYYDELSGFDSDIDGEGSPTALGDTRVQTSSFPKSIRGSTPKIEGSCLISSSILEADAVFVRFLPCPHCKGEQYLKWRDDDERYLFDVDTACYICEHCGGLIGYEKYPDMDRRGQWRTRDGKIIYDEKLDQFFNDKGERVPDPEHLGVEIWSAYSYFMTWADLVKEWKLANEELDRTGDMTKLKTFINTRLGETWKERGERVDNVRFEGERLDRIEQHIPSGVLFLTLGADVQGGKEARIEYEIVGWGLGEESWSIEYGVIRGDVDLVHPWDNLEEVRKRIFTREDGVKMRVSCACIDSGYKSEAVYKYTTPRQGQRVYATKGYAQSGKPIIGKPVYQGTGKRTLLYMIGTDTAKEILYTRLKKIEQPGPGYCHFPEDRDESYFVGLASEEKRKKRDKKTGRTSYVWVKIKERNEPLDCRVENMAALKILNPNFAAIKRRLDTKAAKIAKHQAALSGRKPEQKERPETKPVGKRKTAPSRRRKKGGFVNGWR